MSSALRLALVGFVALGLAGCGGSDSGGSSSTTATPNILFVIMDDVGIDQMAVFGYGGATPASLPNMDQLASAGIRFHNAWSMPACSTSRAAIFEGRFPLRTSVLGALGPDDLANSMVSPYEVTVPKLLAQRGYDSALFGKFHLGIQGHNPAGDAMVHDLGWNYFAGWLDETGDPSSIDTTAGGVAPMGSWHCGFVPSAALGGADSGACYMADGSCAALASSGAVPPGRTCRDRGGIFDPDKSCATPAPDYLNFATLTSHYVNPHMVNDVDLFALFGEIAGIEDVQDAVPRRIDSQPMLPYVVNPNQASIREWNFTQIGNNLQAGGRINPPCVGSGSCSQIPVSKSVCEDNGGVWWGPGADDPSTAGIPAEGFAYCCEVNQFRAAQGESLYSINVLSAVGIRNDQYKIVQNFTPLYVSAEEPCVDTTTVEFYAIDQAVPSPQLDKEGSELPLDALTSEQQQNYDALAAQLDAILASAPQCPGDGNIDGVVDQQDLDGWRFYEQSYGLSSVYDFNLDGVTDAADQSIIDDNLGQQCPTTQAALRHFRAALAKRG